MVRRGGRVTPTPSNHADATSAGATAAFSLLKSPQASPTPLPAGHQRRNGERPVVLAAEPARPPRRREGPPDPGPVSEQRVEHDLGPVVQRKAVPEGAEVYDRRARRHREIEPPLRGKLHEGRSRWAWARSESATTESPRRRANHAWFR